MNGTKTPYYRHQLVTKLLLPSFQNLIYAKISSLLSGPQYLTTALFAQIQLFQLKRDSPLLNEL